MFGLEIGGRIKAFLARIVRPRCCSRGMTARPVRAGIGAATGPIRCRPAARPWTSRSAPSRRGSCASPATDAGRTACFRKAHAAPRARRVELMTGIDGATSRPVRKIVLRQ
jgi:hypothetical protein